MCERAQRLHQAIPETQTSSRKEHIQQECAARNSRRLVSADREQWLASSVQQASAPDEHGLLLWRRKVRQTDRHFSSV